MNVALKSYLNCKLPDRYRIYEAGMTKRVIWKFRKVANPISNEIIREIWLMEQVSKFFLLVLKPVAHYTYK